MPPTTRSVPAVSSAHDADEIGLPRFLRLFASVLAPTTVLTALLLYFGRLHAQSLTRYLRVNSTMFDFTPQDYLVRSADGLFIPITIAALAALIVLVVHRLFLGLVPTETRRRVVRVLAPATSVIGAALIIWAVAVALGAAAPLAEAGGMALALGTALVALSASRRRPRSRGAQGGTSLAEWAAVFLLVSVGLFWAVNSYAAGVGTGRARQIERELATSPDVALYSQRDLALQLPGVRVTRCGGPSATEGFRYRYEGLKFVLQSGNQYLLLPRGWTRASGVAVIIPRTEAVRMEFGPPGSAARPPC